MAKRVIWTCVTMVLAASILLSGVTVFNRLEEKILSTGDELHLLQNTDVVVERSFFPGEDLLFSRPPWTEYEPSRCHPLGGLTERLADPDAFTLNVSQPEDSAILSIIVYLGGSNEDIATLLQECEVSESGNYYWQGVVLHHGITVDAAANPDGDLIYLHIRPLSNQVVTATQASLEIARVEKMVSQFSAPVTDYLARLNNTLTYRGRAGYFGFSRWIACPARPNQTTLPTATAIGLPISCWPPRRKLLWFIHCRAISSCFCFTTSRSKPFAALAWNKGRAFTVYCKTFALMV